MCGVATHPDLEETGRVPYDARLEAHHLEAGEHVVYLSRALDGEYLHGVDAFRSGIGRGRCRCGRRSDRCSGRCWTAARRVEAHLILEFDVVACAIQRVLDQLAAPRFVLELEVGARGREV